MTAVSMFEAKTNLSKYVSYVEEKREPYIVIMRNGKPVARIVPYNEEESFHRLGAGNGLIPKLEDLEILNHIDVESEFFGNGGIL